jgi:hypothetical protein
MKPYNIVTVTTNKSGYEQNETITITMFNGLNVSIFSLAASWSAVFSIERIENQILDEWQSFFAMGQWPECDYDYDFPAEIKSSESVSFDWTPRIWISGCDNFSQAEPGVYRLVISYRIREGNLSENWAWQTVYSNEFTINEQETHLKCEPTVVVTGINYSSNPDDVPYDESHKRFKENYTGGDLSIELRDTIVQNMTERAEQLGENSSIIYEAIKVTYDNWQERPIMIPCYAEKAIYNYEPVWIIAFNRCNGFEDDIRHFDIFYVSIQTLETQWYTGCNSSSVVYWFGCD